MKSIPRQKTEVDLDYVYDVAGTPVFPGDHVYIIDDSDLKKAIVVDFSGIRVPIGHFQLTDRWGTRIEKRKLRGGGARFLNRRWTSDRMIKTEAQCQ